MFNRSGIAIPARWLGGGVIATLTALTVFAGTAVAANAAATVHLTCSGSGAGGTLAAGQVDTCAVWADRGYADVDPTKKVDTAIVSVTAPPGAVVQKCAGHEGTNANANGFQPNSTTCRFTADQLVKSGKQLGTMWILMPSTCNNQAVTAVAEAVNRDRHTEPVEVLPIPVAGPICAAPAAAASSPVALPRTGSGATHGGTPVGQILITLLALTALPALALGIVRLRVFRRGLTR